MESQKAVRSRAIASPPPPPPPGKDPGSLLSSLLRLEMTFAHSTLGASPFGDQEAHECEKNGSR